MPAVGRSLFLFQDSCTYIDITDDHRVAVGVQKMFAFRVAAQNYWLTAGRAGQGRIDELCKYQKPGQIDVPISSEWFEKIICMTHSFVRIAKSV